MVITQLDIGHRFHAALVARDWSAVRNLLADDAQWTLCQVTIQFQELRSEPMRLSIQH